MSADETVDVRALAERIIKEGVGRSQDVPLAIGYCWFGPYPSDDDYVTADMVTALATAYLQAEDGRVAALELFEQEQDALARICKALGVTTDWHAEPFPHLDDVLTKITTEREGRLKAEARIQQLEAALREWHASGAAWLTANDDATDEQYADMRRRDDAANVVLWKLASSLTPPPHPEGSDD